MLGSAAPRREGASAGPVCRLVRSIAMLSRYFERQCLEMGLSLPQYRLLLFARGGPHRAADLATQASVRRPTLTALVDGLEKEGLLVRRAVDGDRRGICLELTEEGHAALERIESHLEAQMTALLQWDDPETTLAGLSAVIGATERLYQRRPADGRPAHRRPTDQKG